VSTGGAYVWEVIRIFEDSMTLIYTGCETMLSETPQLLALVSIIHSARVVNLPLDPYLALNFVSLSINDSQCKRSLFTLRGFEITSVLWD
jgi:hypothetical protein